MSWGQSTKVTSLYKTEEVISPNSDGVKDTVQLHYTVTDSVQLAFSIYNANQQLVRSFGKTHTVPGNDFITWDGRDSRGDVLPDGIYRIQVSGYDFFVEVDSTLPVVAITLAPFKLNELAVSLTGIAYDKNLDNWRLEYGKGENPAEWSVLAEGKDALAQRDQEGQLLLDPLREELIKQLSAEETGRFAGHRFRIVAEDRAGNVSSALSGILEEGIYLFRWDGTAVTDTLPAALVRPGLHDLIVLEIYRLPFTELSLQYRIGKDWLQVPVEILSEGGLLRVKWDNSSVVGGFNAVRLRGVDEAGQEHFSNILTTAQIFSVASKCDQGIWGSNYLFENLQDLRCQHQVGGGDWLDYAAYEARWETIPEGLFFLIPPRGPGQVRLAATGLSGREYFSNAVPYPAPCSPAPKVTIEIQYPVGGTCGDLGKEATITAQVEGKNFSPLALDIFLEQDSGDALLRRYEKSLSGSVTLNTAELAEGALPVRVDFTYLDPTEDMTKQATASASFVADRVPPTAQITYPAGDSLTLCPLSVSDPEGAWHGLPIEAMVLDNHAVRRYELNYGLGESPSVWLPAMTRSGKDRKQLAGEGPIKGRIGIWDLTGLQGMIYTLKLTVVDVAGNTICHTATVAVDTVVAINDLAVGRRLFSPSGGDLLGGFSIGEPAQIDVEVFPLAKNSDNTFRLGYDPVRRLESGRYHPGGAESFSWDGHDQTGAAVEDGEYALAVRATDSCGNGSQRWVPVTVDGTPPEATISYPKLGAPLRTVIEVKGSVSDLSLAGYTLEASQEGAPDSWRIIAAKSTAVHDGVLGGWNTFDLEGVWNLRLSAVDRAGNESQSLVTVDLERRTAVIRGLEVEPRIFSPNGDGQLDQSAIVYDLAAQSQIAIEVLDKGGQQVRTQAFSAPGGPAAFLWDGKNSAGAVVADGEYRVSFTATATATPDFQQTEEVSVVVDSTPPTLVVAEPKANIFLSVADLAFTGTVRDEHLLEYVAELTGPGGKRSLDTGNQNRLDHTFGVLRGLEEGSYVLLFEVADLAGNVTKLSRSFAIDRTAPQVRLDAPQNALLFGGEETQVRIAGEVIEENPVSYRLRYGPGASPTQWVELAGGEGLPVPGELHSWAVDGLLDGEYTLSLLTVDRAGLEGEARVKVTIDNTPPEVSISYPAEGRAITGAAEIKGTASDANFKQAVVSVAEGSCVQAYKWAPLRNLTGPVQNGVIYNWQTIPQDGEYCLRLVAADKIGNEALVARSFMIDTHSPRPPVLQEEFVEKNGLRLEWTVNEEDDLAGYNLYRNGQKVNMTPLSETTWLDANLAEGNYFYIVKAIDLAGNESDPSNEVKRRVDLTPPLVKITVPESGIRLSNFVDIKGTAYSADDFKEYRIYVGASNAPASWLLLRRSPLPVNLGQLTRWDLLSLGEGPYSILLEAEDLSGNIASQQVSVLVDNTPPNAPQLVSVVASGVNVAIAWQTVGDADLAGYLLFRNHQLVNAGGLVIGDLTPYLLKGTSYINASVPDGLFEYYVLAMDQAGNLSDPSNTQTVKIETRSPKATIVEPLAEGRYDLGFMVRAECTDEDIASIRLQYRRSTSSTWLNLTAPFTSPPYAFFFDPQALNLAYGTFHFRGVATDWGGKTDPSPAFIAVTYTDLAPPEGPNHLMAITQGSDIQLTWTANTETDLAGYNIYRVTGTLRTKLNSALIKGIQYLHPNLTDGEHFYEISAVDLYGNESDASEPASARIYAPRQTPLLYGLTSQTQFTLSGSGAEVEAAVEIYSQTPSGLVLVGSGQAGPTGAFTIEGIQLLLGENTLVARAINANGGASKYSAPQIVFRGENPQVPTGLAGEPEDYTVQLDWNRSPESDQVIGYKLYRDGLWVNDEKVKVTLGLPSASSTSSSFAPPRAVDGDPGTYWQSNTSNTAKVPVWLELALPQTEVIRRLEIDWGWTWSYAGRDFHVQGWTGNSWVTLTSVTGNTQRISHIDLTNTMATSRLRIHITGFNSSYGIIVIAELEVFRDSLIEEPVYIDGQGLTDGEYSYQVTAINQFGFESLPSPEYLVGVGDLIPPAAPENLDAWAAGSNVELDWSLTLNTEPDLAGYNVYRQTADSWQRINNTLIPGTSFVDSYLPNGTYLYRITAVDLAGNESEPSPATQITVAAEILGAPVILGVIPIPGGKALSINWQVSADAGYYNLYRSEERGGLYSRVNGDALESLSFLDGSLVNGREYFYVLTALDHAGNESAYSAEVRGKPEDILAPEIPIWYFPARSGEQLSLDRNHVNLVGYAEPGAMIEVFRNGISIGEISALAAESSHTKEAQLNGSGAIPSPDGTKIAFRDSLGALWVKDLTTDAERKLLQQQVFSPVWAPDGSRIAYYSAGRVADVELDSEIITFASADATASEWDPSWSADGSRLVFVSYRGGSWGIWVKEFSSGNLTKVIQGVALSLPMFSPDGKKIAYISSSKLYCYDLAAQTTALIDENVGTFNWSPDSGKLVYRSYKNSRYSIAVFTLDGGEKTQITDSIQLEKFPVFSPDGNSIAFSRWESGSLDSVYLASLSGESRRILSDSGGLQYLDWRRSGQLVLVDGIGLHEIYPQGTFQLEGVELYRGENHFYAIATDQTGNQGLSSEVMTVLFDTSRLPDLSVTAEEVYLYPLSPREEEETATNAVVRNISETPAVNVLVEFHLWDAATGDLKLIGSERLPSLLPHEEATVSALFHAGSIAGKHTLIVVVDPDNLIEEAQESNNTALKEFLVGDEERLELIAGIGSLLYRSRQAVAVDVTLMNGGPVQVLTLEMAVEDELGRPVADLASQLLELPFGAVKNFKPQWNTGTTFAGNYRFRVTAKNASGILAEQLVPFVILPDVMVSAQISTGKRNFGASENVSVGISLKNAGFNNILMPVAVTTTISNFLGDVIYQSEKVIPSLWPGMQSSLTEEWNTGLIPPGDYRVQTEIYVGGARLETASALFTIVAEAILSGEVALPTSVILAGNQVAAGYTIRNSGNAGMSGTLQAYIVDSKTLEVWATDEKNLSLTQGAAQNGEFMFSSQGLVLQSYLIVLKFNAEGVQKIIGSASFTIRDGTPPVMTVLSPQGGESYDAGVPLTIRVADNASGIARVEYQINAGDWLPLPLADPSGGRYSLVWEPALQMGGIQRARFRAYDQAGNSTESGQVEFEIQMDNTAPSTEITFNNQSYIAGETHFVVPETTVTLSAVDDLSGVQATYYRFDDESDEQLYSGPLRLNALAYGPHILRYHSVDYAGNAEEEQRVTLALLGVEVATELLNRPRVLVWTEDPEHGGKAEPPYTLAAIRALLGEAFGDPEIYATVITDKEEFRTLLRSGIYNVVMVIRQDIPLDTVFLREMREAINRGTGLLVSHWSNSMPPLLQELLGVDFKGALPMAAAERTLHLYAGSLGDEQTLNVSGRVLKTTLTDGLLAGIVPAESVCEGVRSLTLRAALSAQSGDQITATLSKVEGKKLVPVDEEQLVVAALPMVAVNRFTGHGSGDLAFIAVTDDGITLSLGAPYSYLEGSYHLALNIAHPDGSSIAIGPVNLTPSCSADLQAGIEFGPFRVVEVDEVRVKTGADLPAVILGRYGTGRTAFLTYDLIASALNGQRSAHLALLGKAAFYLLPAAVRPEAGGLSLLETRIRQHGSGFALRAVDDIGEGMTHVPLFDLRQSPLRYTFHLEDGETAVWRYFVRFADRQGNFAKTTVISLGLESGEIPYADYPASFSVEADAHTRLVQALEWVDEQLPLHPEGAEALRTIREDLIRIDSLPRITSAETDLVIHDIVQIIHQTLQLGIDVTGLRRMLDDYLRIVAGEAGFIP